MANDRDLCCYCVPLRFTVGLLSLIYLGITAATTYQKYSANDSDDTNARIVIYVSCGFQVLIAFLGLLAALTKSVKITKIFSVLWWMLTALVLALSIGSVVIIARHDRSAIEAQCRTSIKPENKLSPSDQEVYNCYRTVIIVSAVVLGIQFLVMVLIGWVIQRYLREVTQDAAIKDAIKAVDEDA
ncbi:hypothetical protein BGZ93_010732 [Podila epicladia]|nr:hypothetical protein BGZ92_000601 [Podila epicladia]KAG0098682.1 hypothetical protein BGZ93_010732 [Podila epicladia]